jgi:hypothetical protein
MNFPAISSRCAAELHGVPLPVRSASVRSSAARHVLHEALLWSAMALLGFGAFYFFDDLKSAFGPGTDHARPLAARHDRHEVSGLCPRGPA